MCEAEVRLGCVAVSLRRRRSEPGVGANPPPERGGSKPWANDVFTLAHGRLTRVDAHQVIHRSATNRLLIEQSH